MLYALLSAAAVAQQTPTTFTVSGRVVATDGEPMRKLTVHLLANATPPGTVVYGGETPSGPETRTGPDGTFSISGVTQGAYRVQVERAGTAMQIRRLGSGSSTTLQVRENLKDVEITVSKETVISGRVVDTEGDPVRNVSVIASIAIKAKGRTRYLPVTQAQTNDRGEYRLFGLAEGDYFVRVIPEAMFRGMGTGVSLERAHEGAFVATFYPSALTAADATPIAVCPGEEGNADVTMRPSTGLHISGTVPVPQKDEMTIVMLAGSENLSMPKQAVVDGQGKFIFKELTPGEYTLTAMVFSQSESNKDGGHDSEPVRLLQNVTVDNQSVEGVTFVPIKGINIAGNIRVADGSKPDFSGLSVGLSPIEEMNREGAIALVNADGTFSLENVQPGDYHVIVNANNLDAQKIFGPHYIASATLDGADVLNEGMHLTAASAPQALRIISNPNGALVTGAVLDSRGKPVVGSAVMLIPEGDLKQREDLSNRTSSRADGSYKFEGVAPGKYAIVAYSPTGSDRMEMLEFASEDAERPGAIHVQVGSGMLKQDLKVTEPAGLKSKLKTCDH
jgi:protocatechuate 3,4-dioxygenase beta subunit